MAVAFFVVLVWPAYQNLQLSNNGIKEKETTLRSKEEYYSQIKRTSIQLQDYSEALLKISDALPKDPSLAALVNFLQTNASQTGLIFKKIVLGGTVPLKEGSLKETQFVIQVSGSYSALKNYLSTIETSSRMIELQSVSMKIPPEESEESPTFTLDIKTYSY